MLKITWRCTDLSLDFLSWEAQRILATEVTRFVHGEKGLAIAESATKILFGGEIDSKLKGEDVTAIFKVRRVAILRKIVWQAVLRKLDVLKMFHVTKF